VISSILSACSSRRFALGAALALGTMMVPVSGQEAAPSSTFSRSVLLPAASVNVSASSPGIIYAQPVAEGTRVKAGQLVVELDPQEEEARLKEAEGMFDATTAELTRAEAAFHRAEELFHADYQSQRQFEEAKAVYERAKAQRKQAEGALDGARLRLERKFVRAPFDGVLLRRFKMPGEAVETFEIVARILDDRYLEMLMFADANQFGTIKLGDKLPIELLDGPKRGTQLEAEVASVDPMIDPASGTFRFKLRITPQENVIVGLSARLLPRPAPTK
jgi:RND family efflux transporter MFP subunit